MAEIATPQANVQKCITFADFVRMLNHGQLHAELSAQLPEIAAALSNHALENGGKAKGKLKVTIDFELKKGVFEIMADFDTTLPSTPRDRTIAWCTMDNFFSPQDPKQIEMFGGPRGVIDATQGEAAARSV